MKPSARLLVTVLGAASITWLACRPSAVAHSIEPATVRIGACDVVKVAARVMELDHFIKPITAKRAELAASVDPLVKEREALGRRLQALGPNASGPEAETLARQYNEKTQALQRQSQQLDVQFDAFRSQKNFEAYKIVLAAVNTVAERRGYAIVLASRGMDDAKPPENPMAFLQGILARPVVRFPQADDLTAEVTAELKLDAQAKPAGDVPAVDPAPPAAKPSPMP